MSWRKRLLEKKKRTGTKLLIGLLLVVPAVYVIVQVATIAARSSALLTQTAVQGTMAESVVCEGFLGMTEQIITYEGSGVLSYIAKNGERVSEGIGVARLFASEADAAQYKRYTALSQEIELLTKAQATGSAGDASLLEKQVQTGRVRRAGCAGLRRFFLAGSGPERHPACAGQAERQPGGGGGLLRPHLQSSQPAGMR